MKKTDRKQGDDEMTNNYNTPGYRVYIGAEHSKFENRLSGDEPEDAYDGAGEIADGISYGRGVEHLPSNAEKYIASVGEEYAKISQDYADRKISAQALNQARTRMESITRSASFINRVINDGVKMSAERDGVDMLGREFKAGASIYYYRQGYNTLICIE